MRYVFTARGLRALRKLPRDVQARIIGKLDWYCAQADPLKFAEPLVGHHIGEYRFRVGDYRVICDREDDLLVVLPVGHSEKYLPIHPRSQRRLRT